MKTPPKLPLTNPQPQLILRSGVNTADFFPRIKDKFSNKMKVPVAKIGEIQKIDVERSSGIVFHDDIGRICTVVKPDKAFDDRGDKSPYRMAHLFGGDWQDYNHHFIVQAAGCPFRCPYCYVDNFRTDLRISADQLVERFIEFKKKVEPKFKIKLKVFHFMGGAPAIYCDFWPELRSALDRKGFKDVVLFSDVILVENHFYKVRPWEYLNLHHFILTGCLKGTNREDFIKNTGGFDLLGQSLRELKHYLSSDNFYLALIAFDEKDLDKIYKIIPKERVDFLTVVNYEVTRRRNENHQNILPNPRQSPARLGRQ